MFRIFYADSDATMYEASSLINSNTGIDEILQVGKQLDTDGETLVKSRFVVKFDMSEIADTLTKYSANLNSCVLSATKSSSIAGYSTTDIASTKLSCSSSNINSTTLIYL